MDWEQASKMGGTGGVMKRKQLRREGKAPRSLTIGGAGSTNINRIKNKPESPKDQKILRKEDKK